MTQTQPYDFEPTTEPLTFTIDVGFTMQRPVIPEQYTSRVTIIAFTEAEAQTNAALMVASRPSVTMPTSTTTVAIEV